MTNSITFKALGATNTLTIYGGGQPDTLTKSTALVDAYAKLLSFYDDQSLVSAINQAAGQKPVHIPVRAVFNLIARAVAWSKRQLDYNALLGPEVALWRIGFDDASVPDEADKAAALALTDPELVYLDPEAQTVFLQKAGMALDLGGIAKGFIIDELARLWAQEGVTGGRIDLAGNCRLVGNSAAGVPLWQIPITDPREPNRPAIATLTTAPKAVVTTGIYFRHFDQDGHVYHHLIDPKTGAPVESSMASITVVADTAEQADVLSSIGFYAGLPKGYDEIEDNGAEALFITKDTQLYKTAGLRETLMPTMGA
ncbi:FAD:protein FMN transferase [Lacticaseibacillus parakribbianus]|uniref:FAD:protein FMN transferase n=1 Tax=Lacticaseibacillus parakribbianus TaxID=2970927 RepID=UPI0021CAF3E3|nr:FAD:protein FMN transferase [Lacticaseibacillus parakribbianus]